MAITIKHAKTDTIADWTQGDLDAQIALGNFPAGTLLADIVLPSDWNNDHTISGTVANPPPPFSTTMLKTGAVSSVLKEKASMSLVFAFALAKLAKKKLALLNMVLLLNPSMNLLSVVLYGQKIYSKRKKNILTLIKQIL
jgi:hypothetical protein